MAALQNPHQWIQDAAAAHLDWQGTLDFLQTALSGSANKPGAQNGGGKGPLNPAPSDNGNNVNGSRTPPGQNGIVKSRSE